MKYIATLYFAISGLFFGWEGIRVVMAGGHFGEPIPWMYEREILAASAAGDTQKKIELTAGLRRFEAQLEKVSGESFAAGILLGAASVLHLLIALMLWLRLSISGLWRFFRKEKRPNKALEPTPTAGTSAAEQPRVPAAVVAHL